MWIPCGLTGGPCGLPPGDRGSPDCVLLVSACSPGRGGRGRLGRRVALSFFVELYYYCVKEPPKSYR